MILAVVRQMAREGRRPARDVVVAMFADEEAGGSLGRALGRATTAPSCSRARPRRSARSAASRSTSTAAAPTCCRPPRRGSSWMRLVADGRAGHGSQVNADNAVTHLAEAVARLGPAPVAAAAHAHGARAARGRRPAHRPAVRPGGPRRHRPLVAALGPASKFVGATLRHTTNPTQLTAGYKANVIPGSRRGDRRRPLPARPRRTSSLATVARARRASTSASSACTTTSALEVPFTGDLVDAMVDALLAEDPDATVLPYTLSGGTDNKSLAAPRHPRATASRRCGCRADLDFAGMFHGVDERVPTDALRFGTRVLDRLLRTC